MMYRVLAVIGGALALGACSSSSDIFSLDALKPAPAVDNVRVESTPPGAEAKASSGQSCRTPCSLALPTSGPATITFSLAGFTPESETLEVVQDTGSPPALRPNPVTVELTPAPPQAKPAARKPAAKKPAAKKPATSQAPKPAPAPAAAASPAQPTASSPWPSTPAR